MALTRKTPPRLPGAFSTGSSPPPQTPERDGTTFAHKLFPSNVVDLCGETTDLWRSPLKQSSDASVVVRLNDADGA
jgi:hypothetical protein